MTTRDEFFTYLLQARSQVKGNSIVVKEVDALIIDFLKDTASNPFEEPSIEAIVKAAKDSAEYESALD